MGVYFVQAQSGTYQAPRSGVFITVCGECAEADAEERAKALNMMRMLANRQNSRWVEAKDWDAPYTFDATKFPTLLGQHTCHSISSVLSCIGATPAVLPIRTAHIAWTDLSNCKDLQPDSATKEMQLSLHQA